MLFDYMQQVQRLLHDPNASAHNPADVQYYINKARREIAMRAECIRVLPPISASIARAHVVTPGSGYTNPTVTISPPDYPPGTQPYPAGLQATAAAIVQNGKIVDLEITTGGAGYFAPTITITDSTGQGASATLDLTWANFMYAGQEVYPFSGINFTAFAAGVKSILSVRSVSVIYANYRYSLPVYSFSTYQAMVRNYPFQYQYVPTIAAQNGRGAAGNFYLYPLPSQTYQMEWDCLCLPTDLTNDQDYEALPEPYTDAVPYMAAYFGFLERQDYNRARGMHDLFTEFTHRYGTATLPGRVSSPYGRW